MARRADFLFLLRPLMKTKVSRFGQWSVRTLHIRIKHHDLFLCLLILGSSHVWVREVGVGVMWWSVVGVLLAPCCDSSLFVKEFTPAKNEIFIAKMGDMISIKTAIAAGSWILGTSNAIADMAITLGDGTD